jgi:hypothetical protein
MNISLYTLNELLHFRSSNDGIYYLSQHTNEEICLYEKNILEFDLDIDNNGNIGIVILDHEGQFLYYYHDGKTWTSHLLYEVDLAVEEFKYISIKFSFNSPYILFCWKDLSSPNLCSIISYYKENNYWKKQVLNRIYINKDIKPYALIKTIEYDLYFISLHNNNMIYDLIMKTLSSTSYEWTEPSFICNCISLKNFYLDALIDSERTIHISWIDKYKNQYCIKYVFIDIENNQISNLEQLLQVDVPLLRQQLLCQEKSIFCYVVSKEHIYFIRKNEYSTWNTPHTINLSPTSIYFIKIVQNIDTPFIQYHANYILSTSSSDLSPISIEEINIEKSSFDQSNHSKTNTIHHKKIAPTSVQDLSLDTYKTLQMELYQRSEELEIKNNLIKALQGNISFLKGELHRLNTQNENYINTLYSNDHKFKKYKSNTQTLENNYKKILSDFDLYKQKNEMLLSEINTYEHQLKKMKEHLNQLHEENLSLKNKIETLKNTNLLKRLFH